MFVPLHDDTPLRVIRFQYVTVGIIIANIVIFIVTGATQSDAVLATVAQGFGVVPSELAGHAGEYNPVPEPFTLVTYMFLHASWLHLLSNMLFMWVFADNVEDAFGYAGFLIFYLICGIAGGIVFVLMSPGSTAPLIGASGAVSGVLAAYMVLFPKARVWVLFFLRIPWRMSALWVLGLWFGFQVLSLFVPVDAEVQVAWWAHIGGFLTGLVITFMFRPHLLVR